MSVCLRLCLVVILCLSMQVPALALAWGSLGCGHAAPAAVVVEEGCCDGQMPATPHAGCDAASCGVHCAATAGIASTPSLESVERIAEQVPAPGFRARIAPVYRHERPPRATVTIL